MIRTVSWGEGTGKFPVLFVVALPLDFGFRLWVQHEISHPSARATAVAFSKFGSSAKRIRQPACSANRWTVDSGRVVARGTVTAPTRIAPRRTNTHCGMFSIRIPTRSPRLTPLEIGRAHV